MTDLADMEGRLRHTLHTVAECPPGSIDLEAPAPAGYLWTVSHWHLAAISFAVVAAAVIVGLVLLPTSRSHQQVIINRPGVTAPASTATSTAPLPPSAGTEEQLDPASAPYQPYPDESKLPGGMTIEADTAHSFSVAGSPPFEIAHATVSAHPTPGGGRAPAEQGVAELYLGVGGYSGTGGDSMFQPSTNTTESPVQVIPDWPQAGKQLYIWTSVPAATGYVSYSYNGVVLAWEHPQYGLVALLVPRPAAFDGNYATWHTAPFGTLRAYNSGGQLLQQLTAPRIGGDDMKISP